MPLSNDVLFGLIRGISNYDELCADKKLCEMVEEEDTYFCHALSCTIEKVWDKIEHELWK